MNLQLNIGPQYVKTLGATYLDPSGYSCETPFIVPITPYEDGVG